MNKRILALLLSLLLTTGWWPVGVSAASEEEQDRIRQQIQNIYWKTLSASGMSSMHGYCGAMAGWELYYMGVTETAVTRNGNEMYDVLSSSEKICPGYQVRCYPSSEYSIAEALNVITDNGTRDAYNIMVGFQRTNTAAGSIYGHVTVIHAVLDGVVYFATPFQADPSQSMECSISEFASFYNSWASFEGILYFGQGSYVENCESFGCDLFVAVTESVTLQTMPEQENTQYGRSLLAGERLYADVLCRNEAGELYYRVWENSLCYFVPALLVEPVWFAADGLTVSDIDLPVQLRKGKDHTLSGVIRSQNSLISNLYIEVLDGNGVSVISCDVPVNGYMMDLHTNMVNSRMDVSSLQEGGYTYQIFCDLTNYYSNQGQLIENVQRIELASAYFIVGDKESAAKAIAAGNMSRAVKNGWQYEAGNWYYYENDMCRTGWFCYEGVDYYLQEDGTAATGWQTINGKNRYFSETGAMRIGWLTTEEGTYYMLSNGVPAVGTVVIDDIEYNFDVNGKLQNS